jgi:hypothetical protein
VTVYTPTTETIRSGYADYWNGDAVPTGHGDRVRFREQFDRWLATVKAEAWDEGHGSGLQAGFDLGASAFEDNPYRDEV